MIDRYQVIGWSVIALGLITFWGVVFCIAIGRLL